MSAKTNDNQVSSNLNELSDLKNLSSRELSKRKDEMFLKSIQKLEKRVSELESLIRELTLERE